MKSKQRSNEVKTEEQDLATRIKRLKEAALRMQVNIQVFCTRHAGVVDSEILGLIEAAVGASRHKAQGQNLLFANGSLYAGAVARVQDAVDRVLAAPPEKPKLGRAARIRRQPMCRPWDSQRRAAGRMVGAFA